MKTNRMVLCALMAALIAVFSQIAIPLPGLVPINLATLAVFLCGSLLGHKDGVISVIVFLGLGAVGLPVFSGFRGGLSVLSGPTGGYLAGYLLAALVIGLLLRMNPTSVMLPISMVIGLTICYTLGTAWYMLSTHTPLQAALLSCIVPFLLGDLFKIMAAFFITKRLGILQYDKPKMA